MKGICSGLGHQGYRTRRFHAVLCARRAGLDLEFLQRIGEWQRYIAVILHVVVVGPIQRVAQSRV